jgi:hypothetical protein
MLKATVRDGRIVVDEPTGLPDGTVLNLVVEMPEDQMSEEELAQINASIAISMEEIKAAKTVPGAQVLAEVRKLRISR